MNKIDFVITWVDPTDEKWQEERNKYKGDNTIQNKQYRDYDSLKYLFRSIEKYAGWVNKIYLVTCGQKPSWLNVNNPKICLIDHKDYIPEKYLPTFNSNAIELNFNKIESLSENFVYFNDDMLLTNYCSKDYFFKNGNPCDAAILNTMVPSYEDSFYKILNNNTEIINKYYDKDKVLRDNHFKWYNIKYGKELIRNYLLKPWKGFTGMKPSHVPVSHKKSYFDKLWEMEPSKMNDTCMNKFRSSNDINHFLIENLVILDGKFEPRKVNSYKYFYLNNLPSNFANYIRRKKYKMICVNDTNMTDEEYSNCSQYLINELNKMFPNKSGFEI